MSEAAHSKYSASAAKRWMNCPGSMVLSAGLVDSGSKYAAEGTLAHSAAEEILRTGVLAETQGVDGDMIANVGVYVANINQYATDAEVLVEQRLNYSKALGVATDEAWGTADAVILKGNEIQVHDLKYGQGELVSAEDNEQMQLYALGALDAFDGLAGDFSHVRMVIHQVRVDKRPQEWDIPVTQLQQFGVKAKQAAHLVKAAEFSKLAVDAGQKTQEEWEADYLNPGEGQCRWCRAKATCPALRDMVAATIVNVTPATPEEFDDLTVPNVKEHLSVVDNAWLAASMGKAKLIEDWLKGVRAEVERRLLAGTPIPGYKLVQGRQGDRSWRNADEAEQLLKSFRLKEAEMYKFSLISPTKAEEVLKESPKRWKKAQELIERKPGGPSVAPATDKREALVITPTMDEFETLDDGSDLG